MSDFIGFKEVARRHILDLKCWVCKDVPSSIGVRKNRYACSQGHLICEDCKSGECSCGSKSFNGPLGFVESVMEKSQWHYCCHFKHGCKDMFGARDLYDHQKSCIFREIVCLENKCKKQILFRDFIDHVDSDHKDWNDEEIKEDENTFIVSFSQENIFKNCLKFEAANFTQLNENMVYSEPIYVQNLPWKIGVYTYVIDSVKYVACYIKCDGQSKSTTWSCQAKVELSMINHEDAKRTCIRRYDALFNSERPGLLCKQFMKWSKAIEPEAGFLKNSTVTFELKIKADLAKGLNSSFPKVCDSIIVGTPTMLKTSSATFFLARQKECGSIQFRIYMADSGFEAENFAYILTIMDGKTGKPKHVFRGEVFTLDKDDPHEGSVFMMGAEDARKICEENYSKFDLSITIRNLEEEAMDEDESSGLSDGTD